MLFKAYLTLLGSTFEMKHKLTITSLDMVTIPSLKSPITFSMGWYFSILTDGPLFVETRSYSSSKSSTSGYWIIPVSLFSRSGVPFLFVYEHVVFLFITDPIRGTTSTTLLMDSMMVFIRFLYTRYVVLLIKYPKKIPSSCLGSISRLCSLSFKM